MLERAVCDTERGTARRLYLRYNGPAAGGHDRYKAFLCSYFDKRKKASRTVASLCWRGNVPTEKNRQRRLLDGPR